MKSYESKAKDYIERAEELRVVAAGMRSEYARDTLLRCAEDYERMAGWAEGAKAGFGLIGAALKH